MHLLAIFVLIFLLYYQIYLLVTKSRRQLQQRLAKYTAPDGYYNSDEFGANKILMDSSSSNVPKSHSGQHQNQFGENGKTHGIPPWSRKKLTVGLKNLTTLITKVDRLKGIRRYLDGELIKSGILLRGEEFISILALSGVVGGVVFYVLTTSLIGIFLGLLLGSYAPWLLVRIKKKKRQGQFNEQLGEVLTTVANALRSGHSLLKAIEMVSKDSSYPASQEFSYTVKEMQLGISTEEALKNMESRIESEDLNLVVTAILIQRQVGGNLAEVLDSISDTIRDRLRIYGEIKTLTAQGKLSGIIISLLPVLLGMFFYIMNPDYIMELFTDPRGLLLVVMAVFSQLIGALFIKKIIEIEV